MTHKNSGPQALTLTLSHWEREASAKRSRVRAWGILIWNDDMPLPGRARRRPIFLARLPCHHNRFFNDSPDTDAFSRSENASYLRSIAAQATGLNGRNQFVLKHTV